MKTKRKTTPAASALVASRNFLMTQPPLLAVMQGGDYLLHSNLFTASMPAFVRVMLGLLDVSDFLEVSAADLSHREVVGSAPVTVHPVEHFRRQRAGGLLWVRLMYRRRIHSG